MIPRVSTILAAFLLNSLLGAAAQAGPQFKSVVDLRDATDWAFLRGQWEAQTVAGVLFSPVVGPRTTFDYALAEVRFGKMITNPAGPSILRGNFEALFGIYGGASFEGPSGVLGGFNLFGRWNFVQPGAKFVPYCQLGAGMAFNNIYTDRNQSSIGSAVEFDLQGSFGFRWFIRDRFALTGEVIFQHISNANTASRNYGTNGLGGMLGVACFF
jgi:lipid A 3-O-deacylase